jgi:3-deoxy-D-manno-octulosonic-acid transferase
VAKKKKRLPLPMTLRIYRGATRALTPFMPLLLSHRARRGKESSERMVERRGITTVERPHGPIVWLHGASVGELASIFPLIERLRSLDWRILVTSGTTTSAALARERLPPDVIHQFIPIDTPRFMAQFLDYWQPSLALFVESDLWPNLIMASAERKIPIIIVNGRLSERSFQRWRALHGTARALMARIELCLAQSSVDANRFSQLGARQVQITGNLKLDVPAPPVNEKNLNAMRIAAAGRPVVVAASTHDGEDMAMVEAHRRLRQFFPDLLTVIAPRHVQRGRDIYNLAERAGFVPALRSQRQLPDKHTQIYVADTMGELGLLYRLSSIVFMGGSLVEHGGQNPIEAIKLGAAVVHGPHVWNFAEIYAALDAARGAEEVDDPVKLAACLNHWLKNAGVRMSVAASAQKTIERLGGALDRTVSQIEPYLMQLRLEHRADDA